MFAFNPGNSLLALCDCNNFFVSCERLYRPDLKDKPVVVLSANDGCVISRSNEVKAMGIKMGEPYFQLEGFFKAKGVTVFSGNHRLYSEISAKVMRVLSGFTDSMEVYSIDEAFLNLNIGCVEDPVAYAAEIRRAVGSMVGIPISIGIAPSKTLSKLASEKAKKHVDGVFRIDVDNYWPILEKTPVADIWGIGWRSDKKLSCVGIHSAADLAKKDPVWVKRKLTVRGSMTQLELFGYPCTPIVEVPPPPKTIQVSHSFGEVLRDRGELELPLIEHALKAAGILRTHGLAAKGMSIYLLEGYVSKEHRHISKGGTLPSPACDDLSLIHAAKQLLAVAYKSNTFYTKAGVTLFDLRDARYLQTMLFDDNRELNRKRERVAAAADVINGRLGGRAIYPASLAVAEKKWKCKSEKRSEGALRFA